MQIGQKIIIQKQVFTIIDPPMQDSIGVITLKIAGDRDATTMLHNADLLRAKA